MSIYSMPGRELVPLILEKLKQGEEFPLVVTGHSMSPTLYHLRDRVYLVSAEKREPKKYDIVLFVRKDGAYVLHRILSVLPDGKYLINGDAQTWTESIERSQILAVVGRIERNNRQISCDNNYYKAYVTFWIWLKPIRGYIMELCRKLKKLRIS